MVISIYPMETRSFRMFQPLINVEPIARRMDLGPVEIVLERVEEFVNAYRIAIRHGASPLRLRRVSSDFGRRCISAILPCASKSSESTA